MEQKFGIGNILRSAFPPQNAGNILPSDPISGLPPTTLLETLVPGYGAIHKFLLFTFGFDVTVLVSLGVVVWLSGRIFRSVWTVICATVASNYIA
jgi:chaperone BCS1